MGRGSSKRAIHINLEPVYKRRSPTKKSLLLGDHDEFVLEIIRSLNDTTNLGPVI